MLVSVLQQLRAELDKQNRRRLVLCRQAVERWLGYNTDSSLSGAWLEFKSHVGLAKLQRIAAAASGDMMCVCVIVSFCVCVCECECVCVRARLCVCVSAAHRQC